MQVNGFFIKSEVLIIHKLVSLLYGNTGTRSCLRQTKNDD